MTYGVTYDEPLERHYRERGHAQEEQGEGVLAPCEARVEVAETWDLFDQCVAWKIEENRAYPMAEGCVGADDSP